MATGEEEPRPGAWTRSLYPNTEFQLRKPPVWPRFANSNHHIYTYEFRCQVVVLFLQLPLSSCVVRKACTSYSSLHNTYWHNVYSLEQFNVVNGQEFKMPTLTPSHQTSHAQSNQARTCAQWPRVEFPDVGWPAFLFLFVFFSLWTSVVV